MKDVKTLQELINERAEKRLNSDLSSLSKLIRDNPLLSPTDNPGLPNIQIEGDSKPQKPFWFFEFNTRTSSNSFFNKVKDFWLPQYIAQETEDFIKKVDELMDFKDHADLPFD